MRLRVLTLNVWGLPLGLTRHHDSRMQAIGEGFARSGADIIALQEVWTADARTLLADAGKRAGYRAIWHREAAFGGSGLMVLSRLPITGHRFTRFRLAGLPQRPHHADFYAGKGFVSIELASDAGPLTLVDTHLHAGYSAADAPDEYRGIRAAQAVEIAASLRAVQTPVVATGDFNTSEDDEAYAILLGLSGLRDLAVVLDRRQATCLSPHPYRGVDSDASRIDLVLARGGPSTRLEAISIDRTFDEPLAFGDEPGAYSDHAGLLATLELTPRLASDAPFAWPPLEPGALDRAEAELQWGIGSARSRRQRELGFAAGGLGAGLLAGGGAWRARSGRRRFLSGLAMGLAGLGLFGGLTAALGSHWVVENELAGLAAVQEILARLRTESAQAVRLTPHETSSDHL